VYYRGSLSPDFYGWVFPHGNTVSVGTGSADKGFSLRSAVGRLRETAGLGDSATLRREGAPLPMKPLPRWDNGRDVVLVGDAAGVVAAQASDAELADLNSIHQELVAAVGNTDRFFAINERFHMRLLEIANNRWRDQMVADLRKVMKLNRHNSLLKSGRMQESLSEHRALMVALEKRDAGLSVKKMQAHFANGLEAAA
jgi:hypothetical protein